MARCQFGKVRCKYNVLHRDKTAVCTPSAKSETYPSSTSCSGKQFSTWEATHYAQPKYSYADRSEYITIPREREL